MDANIYLILLNLLKNYGQNLVLINLEKKIKNTLLIQLSIEKGFLEQSIVLNLEKNVL